MAKPRLALLIPDLRCGGLERLCLDLAREWLSIGYRVDLLVLQKRGELLLQIPDGSRLIDLRAKRLRQLFLPLYRYLRNDPPDLLWAHLWPLTSVAVLPWLAAGRPCPLWLSEHTTLSLSALHELHLPRWVVRLVLMLTYPFATGLTAVSQGVAIDLIDLGVSCRKLEVVPNPAAVGRSAKPMGEEHVARLWGAEPVFKLLSVGSLKAQKNHALLLQAVALLPDIFRFQLVILGDGPLRQSLEQIIRLLGLQDRVRLLGFVEDPTPWYRSADLFVLSSSWEGFGNVLVEALECGLPVVSTDCPSGPSEILAHGRFGSLVEPDNPQALAQAIHQAWLTPVDRDALISRSTAYACSTIAMRYLDVFGLTRHE